MDITDNTLDFNKICRLCLTEETVMSSIYNEDDTETNSVPLPLRIMSCVSVEVSTIYKSVFLCKKKSRLQNLQLFFLRYPQTMAFLVKYVPLAYARLMGGINSKTYVKIQTYSLGNVLKMNLYKLILSHK